MTGTNHFLAGALVAMVAPHPIIAGATALVSHLVLDALPHFGRSSLRVQNVVVVSDMVCLMVLVGMMWEANRYLAIICGFLAMALDLIWIPLYRAQLLGRHYTLNRIEHALHALQWGERPWGLAIEVPFGVLLFGLLIHQLL